MTQTIELKDSSQFSIAALAWAKTVNLVDTNGIPIARFPDIIGMPAGSLDLGAFNYGIIQSNRTIKQAFQDLETDIRGRLLGSNNLSELTDVSAARTRLNLGTASTWNVGTTGAVIPLLSGNNNWTGTQDFTNTISMVSLDLRGSSGSFTNVSYSTSGKKRWDVSRDSVSESGNNIGSDFRITRYADDGTTLGTAVSISRATGVVSLGTPLPVTSGGTGVNTLSSLKTALSIDAVNNTSDANKPISTATQTALNSKVNLTGGVLSGAISIVPGNGNTVDISTDGSIEITRSLGGSYIDFKSQSSQDYEVRLQANGTTLNLSGDFGVYGNSNFRTTTITSQGTMLTLVSSGAEFNGIRNRSNYASSTQRAVNFIDNANETGTVTSSIYFITNTDGSSEFQLQLSAAGSRTADRRTAILNISSTAITPSVPINGRAYGRRSDDGSNLNFFWSGQTGQPNWLWGGNDGSNMYIYNPSNFSVSNSANLNGKPESGFIKRSTDLNYGNGNLSRQLVLAGSVPTNAPWSAPLEIREVNQVLNSQSDPRYAPAIAFHWSQITAGSIKLRSDGDFSLQADGGDNNILYKGIYVSTLRSSEHIRFSTDGQILWDNRGVRGITVADNGAVHGHINVIGPGLNGWSGYAIGTIATFMGNSTNCGIYSSNFGDWLLRYDSNYNAYFPRNVTYQSDERFKDNIRPISDIAKRREGLAKAAIMYERYGHTEVGFGAQTLETSNAELVTTDDSDLIGMKSVSYGNVTAILAADNQMLSDRIDALEAKISELTALIDSKNS